MDYISNTPEDIKKMLELIGVEDVEELFSLIPEKVALKDPLNIPDELSELELKKLAVERAASNITLEDKVSFMGAGSYDHFIPSIVDHMISRTEFYTAYTPYQAELSQGTLQATYEYQSMICELTGMDISNASLLDGGSAVAEAVSMASRITRKKKILLSKGVHPAYREVADTYGHPISLELKEIPLAGAVTDINALAEEIDEDTAAVVVQYPNFYGSIEDMRKIKELIAAQKKTLFIVVTNPIALGLLKEPSEFGADIVVGEGQPLGNVINFGGPYFGFMAIKDDRKLLRQMPGRIVGGTKDVDGKKGFVLTMQTREQHIRREKATSNICSNEALNTLIAAVYMSAMGKEGIKELAEQSMKKAHYLANKIDELEGFQVLNKDNFFHEFWVKSSEPVSDVKKKLFAEGFLAGVDLSCFEEEEGLLICVTEKRTKDEMDALLTVLGGEK